LPDCDPLFDLLCEEYEWVLLGFGPCYMLCLGPALLQWDVLRVLRRR